MFTGIVDHCGEIVAVEATEQGLRAAIECQYADLMPGESISIEGVCLTVTDPKEQTFYVDISKETYDLTTVKNFMSHQKVNLERAMRASDRFGGHYVTGHVESIARIAKKELVGDCEQITFSDIPATNMKFLLEKGSVCVNGVSLTINTVTPDGFSVMLIPHTLSRTSLQFLKHDDWVNIEFDWMVKTVLSRLTEKGLENAAS